MLNYKILRIHRDELIPGFIGETCSFEYKLYKDRTTKAQRAFDLLSGDVLRNGMINPLITFKGKYILIGMRRFEILKSTREYFPCADILENVAEFKAFEIKALKLWVSSIYQPAEGYVA